MAEASAKAVNVVCVASYFKGDDFLRECKQQGARVELLTRQRTAHEAWPRESVDQIHFLPDEAGAELWGIKRELKERLQPAAEATVERSGTMRYNGASVAHFHVHFVALEPEPEKTVRFRVSREAEAAWR